MNNINIRLKVAPFFKRIKNDGGFKIAVITFLYLIFVVVGYYLQYRYGEKYKLPTEYNLLSFDGYWYYTIKEFGYQYSPGAGYNLAFFPLFPLVWQISGLSSVLISALNCLIFVGSFIYLFKSEKADYTFFLFLLSFPSLIFFALPYSESLFFLFSSFIIVGYKKGHNMLIYIGLFGASTVRSVSMIFIPAIIIVELLTLDPAQLIKHRIKSIILKSAAAGAGFIVAVSYTGYSTGKWFYFIEVQKFWHRRWLLPKFPLTTLSPERVLGVDAIAFILGFFGAYLCFKALLSKFTRNVTLGISKEVVFSALYLAAITVLDSCFTYNVREATNIWSINRHLMCTPFSMILLEYIYKTFHPRIIERICLLTAMVVGIFLTGTYQYMFSAVFFVLFFSALYIGKYYDSYCKNWMIIYFIIAAYLQIGFYNGFLSNLWLG